MFTTEQVSKIAQARTSSPLLYLELYCNNPDCGVREVRLRIKDYDQTLVADVRRGVLRCPVCGKPSKLHWVLTALEQDVEDRAAARRSVNSQMRERDYQATHKGRVLFVETLQQILDDRLPPTPDGWFAEKVPHDVP